jgi:hypothetical protein
LPPVRSTGAVRDGRRDRPFGLWLSAVSLTSGVSAGKSFRTRYFDCAKPVLTRTMPIPNAWGGGRAQCQRKPAWPFLWSSAKSNRYWAGMPNHRIRQAAFAHAVAGTVGRL